MGLGDRPRKEKKMAKLVEVLRARVEQKVDQAIDRAVEGLVARLLDGALDGVLTTAPTTPSATTPTEVKPTAIAIPTPTPKPKKKTPRVPEERIRLLALSLMPHTGLPEQELIRRITRRYTSLGKLGEAYLGWLESMPPKRAAVFYKTGKTDLVNILTEE